MIINLKIKNISGVTDELYIDFISKSRYKNNLTSVFQTHDELYVNKQMAIIGSNSSGKTSILRAITDVGNFINASWLKKLIYENLEKSSNIPDITNLTTQLKQIGFITPNYNIGNSKAFFEITLYVNDNPNTTGYYTYQLIFDKNFKETGCIKELLTFKKTYNSKKEIELINISGNFEGQVGYLMLYHKNIESLNSDENLSNINYIHSFYNHYIKYSNSISIDKELFDNELSIIAWAQTAPKTLLKILQIIDNNIIDLIVKDTDINTKQVFFIQKNNNQIPFNYLSTGTKKMIHSLNNIIYCIKKNGIFLIDEIERGIHFDLIKLILQLFTSSNKSHQILFTTHQPDILDRDFKLDQIVYLDKKNCSIIPQKLSETIIDGKKIRLDKSFSNLYKEKKVAFHPYDKEIKSFIESLI